YLGHDRVLEAPDELVEAFHRLAECVATVLDMLRHDGDAPIELTAELVDVLRVLGDLFLTPAERDGLGKRDERRGGGDDHALRRGVLEERGITDRKSTRLNSSHQIISYAVFCLKKKNKTRCLLEPQYRTGALRTQYTAAQYPP